MKRTIIVSLLFTVATVGTAVAQTTPDDENDQKQDGKPATEASTADSCSTAT